MISAVLLDLAGVIYDGESAVPGAAEAVARLRAAGIPIRFVSNTTRSSKLAILARLAKLRLPVTSDELFTPAEAACDWLRERGLPKTGRWRRAAGACAEPQLQGRRRQVEP